VNLLYAIFQVYFISSVTVEQVQLLVVWWLVLLELQWEELLVSVVAYHLTVMIHAVMQYYSNYCCHHNATFDHSCC